MSKPDSGSHEFQATGVTGIKGGKIMCEMRTQSRTDGSRPPRENKRHRDNDVNAGDSQAIEM